MADPLAGVGASGAAVTRVYVAVVTARTGNTCSVDPGDGQVVTGVPWYGQTPVVGDAVVMLLSAGQLLVLSMGRP